MTELIRLVKHSTNPFPTQFCMIMLIRGAVPSLFICTQREMNRSKVREFRNKNVAIYFPYDYFIWIFRPGVISAVAVEMFAKVSTYVGKFKVNSNTIQQLM